jgi:hypothetical protein
MKIKFWKYSVTWLTVVASLLGNVHEESCCANSPCIARVPEGKKVTRNHKTLFQRRVCNFYPFESLHKL